uniref:Uncharacterized protein n=1 Tax=Cacopsylla melanoneura TaxID=428564 RepID=A0A8D9BFE7_9HEMI
MADTLSIITHFGLVLIAAYILAQGRIPFWISNALVVYIIYGIAGLLAHFLNNNTVNKVFSIAHDVAYIFAPAFTAIGVAIGIYGLQEEFAYIFLIVPLLYVIDYFMKNIDGALLETLTQVTCLAIAMFSALSENYEGAIAGVLFLLACISDHIHAVSSAKDVAVINGFLIVGCIAIWYAFGGGF